MAQLMITDEGYQEMKQNIKNKLNETVNNFIVIGYYLKQIKDNMLYIKDGYGSMKEFVQKEYRLHESTARRLMEINTKFSVDGNSLKIKEEYVGFGYSKLQEMLTVSDDDKELITEDTTVSQIKELKKLEREEEAELGDGSLPLVQMAEKDTAPVKEKTKDEIIHEVIADFWKEKEESLKGNILSDMLTAAMLAEQINPAGTKTYRAGLSMLFFYSYDVGIKLRSIFEKKPWIENITYDSFLELSKEVLLQQREEPEVIEAEYIECATSQEEYEPLPGQITTKDLGIDPENITERKPEEVREDTEASEVERTIPEQHPELVTMQDEAQETKQEDSLAAVYNAELGYFETEYERMANKESLRARSYRLAIELITGCRE